MQLIPLFLSMIFFLVFLFFIWIHTAPLHAEGADVMIILGYRCDDDQIHPFLMERLQTALRVLHSFPVKKIIVTGGVVGFSRRSEAELMREYLVKHRVDQDLIYMDLEARDTIENLINCKDMMIKEDLHTCLIITNSFHIRRVQYIAQKVGLNASFYANRRWRLLFKQLIRTLNEIRAFIITIRLLRKVKN